VDPKTGNSIYHYMDYCVRSMVILGMEYEMNERIRELVGRITEYLSAGGLFNPELMEHEKVRDLLIECREVLYERTNS